jgi:hypothetical protein
MLMDAAAATAAMKELFRPYYLTFCAKFSGLSLGGPSVIAITSH